MRKIFVHTLMILALGMLSSCYGYRQVGLLQERDDLPQYDSAAYEPYRLQVNDEIIYRVVTMDETIAKTLSANNNGSGQYANSYRIYSDGTVDIPFLPPVKLEGLTELEAQDTLRAAFREIIPDADVKLALYNKKFTVLGDANSGTYTIYKERMTIFQALAMTGDLMN
jgi:polysaccharide export outer membrane protein